MGSAEAIVEAFGGLSVINYIPPTDEQITKELQEREMRDTIERNNRLQVLGLMFPSKHRTQDFWGNLPVSTDIFEEDDSITKTKTS